MKALEDEMDEFAAAMTERDRDRLVAAGVCPAAKFASQIDNWLAPIGVTRAAVVGDLFEPREVGEEMFVLPVTAAGQLVDLIAWRAADPRRFWPRRGDAELLGFDVADRAIWFADPLKVFETPLKWLAAAGQGAVVLRWPAGASWLSGARLVVETRSLAARLDKAVNAPLAPTEIFVKRAA